jgi:uncharacterized protein YidB (DUF937 family)
MTDDDLDSLACAIGMVIMREELVPSAAERYSVDPSEVKDAIWRCDLIESVTVEELARRAGIDEDEIRDRLDA